MFPINFQKRLFLKSRTKILELVRLGEEDELPTNLNLNEIFGRDIESLDRDVNVDPGNFPPTILDQNDLEYLERLILKFLVKLEIIILLSLSSLTTINFISLSTLFKHIFALVKNSVC